MNLFLFILGLLFTVAFIFIPSFFNAKTLKNKNQELLFKTILPVVLLFCAIIVTSYSMVGYRVVNDTKLLPKAFENLQKKEQEEKNKEAKKALSTMTDEDFAFAPIVGNKDGKITIYTFFDYNCGYCRKNNEVEKDIIASEKDVKIVLKNFPIFPPSMTPAKAMIAAKEQGMEKVEKFHNALFAANLNPEKGSKKTVKDIVMDIAKKSGLDVKKLEKDMEKPVVEEELLRTRKLAEKLGFQGTPAHIVGDQIIGGYVNTETMKETLKKVRK